MWSKKWYILASKQTNLYFSLGAEPDASSQRPSAGDEASPLGQYNRTPVPAAAVAARDQNRPPEQAACPGMGQPASLWEEGGQRAQEETCTGAKGASKKLKSKSKWCLLEMCVVCIGRLVAAQVQYTCMCV